MEKKFSIGVISDSFRLGLIEGVRKAKAVGAEGLQVYAVSGEMSPEQMDAPARQRFKALCKELDLVISALCGDLGGHGFQRAAENPAKMARSKLIVDLAAELGTSVVTTHIGVIPDDSSSPVYRVMRDACQELGRYAAAKGITFAVETGPEIAVTLRKFLDDVGTRGVGANLDPANLAMVSGDDPVRAVETLAPYIVHTHAKDGRRLQACDAAEVYGSFADGTYGELVKRKGPLFEEVPLGQGSVKWDAYLAALDRIGYRGFLTIEREVGADPAADIAMAVEFLKTKRDGRKA